MRTGLFVDHIYVWKQKRKATDLRPLHTNCIQPGPCSSTVNSSTTWCLQAVMMFYRGLTSTAPFKLKYCVTLVLVFLNMCFCWIAVFTMFTMPLDIALHAALCWGGVAVADLQGSDVRLAEPVGKRQPSRGVWVSHTFSYFLLESERRPGRSV